jgi:membrane-associated phospholipid phosphatase
VHGVAVLAATSLVANQAAKRISFRPRPDQGPVPARRRFPSKRSSSFPSGHTASAFAFTVVAGGRRDRFTVLLAITAAAVGLSRVFTGPPYPTDVLAGAVLGTGTGWAARTLIINRDPATVRAC